MRTILLTTRLDNYENEELSRILKETKQNKSTFVRTAILEKIQRIDLKVEDERTREENRE